MKLKNVKIGMKVQVKENADNWTYLAKGCIGEVLATDTSVCPVLVQFEDGCQEWGGHKGLRKIKGSK